MFCLLISVYIVEVILLSFILYDLEHTGEDMECIAKIHRLAHTETDMTDTVLHALSIRHRAYVITTARKCAVCIDWFEDGDNVLIVQCPDRHMFHTTCLKGTKRCPVCNVPL